MIEAGEGIVEGDGLEGECAERPKTSSGARDAILDVVVVERASVVREEKLFSKSKIAPVPCGDIVVVVAVVVLSCAEVAAKALRAFLFRRSVYHNGW